MKRLFIATALFGALYSTAAPVSQGNTPASIQPALAEAKALLPDGPASSHSIESVYRICQDYVYRIFRDDPFGITMANWILQAYGATWRQLAFAWGTQPDCHGDIMGNLGNYAIPEY